MSVPVDTHEATPATPAAPPTHAAIVHAIYGWARGQLAESLATLETVIHSDPQNVSALLAFRYVVREHPIIPKEARAVNLDLELLQRAQDAGNERQLEAEALLSSVDEPPFVFLRGALMDVVWERPLEAVAFYQKAANADFPPALCNLGIMYQDGSGGQPCQETAAELFSRATKLGYAWAQNNLGVLYQNGAGVTQDSKEAVRLYKLAADRGNAWAEYNLGWCYHHGQGTDMDVDKAVECYRQSSWQGYAMAQCNLGVCYQNGDGVPVNLHEAARLYRLAALQGNDCAQHNIGVLYEVGRGVNKDLTQAMQWLRQSADQGNQAARMRLMRRQLPDAFLNPPGDNR